MSFHLGIVLTHLYAPKQQTDKTPDRVTIIDMESVVVSPYSSCGGESEGRQSGGGRGLSKLHLQLQPVWKRAQGGEGGDGQGLLGKHTVLCLLLAEDAHWPVLHQQRRHHPNLRTARQGTAGVVHPGRGGCGHTDPPNNSHSNGMSSSLLFIPQNHLNKQENLWNTVYLVWAGSQSSRL